MKALGLLPLNAAMSAVLVLVPANADAAPVGIISNPPPPSHHGGMHGFHRPIFIVEREVVIEREVAPKPADPQPAPVEPPPPPRKPYVLGRTYASLPDGCMKLIEDGASYYYCSGEWYRQVRAGGGAQYKAVLKPL